MVWQKEFTNEPHFNYGLVVIHNQLTVSVNNGILKINMLIIDGTFVKAKHAEKYGFKKNMNFINNPAT
jgi:hypothetical protein